MISADRAVEAFKVWLDGMLGRNVPPGLRRLQNQATDIKDAGAELASRVNAKHPGPHDLVGQMKAKSRGVSDPTAAWKSASEGLAIDLAATWKEGGSYDQWLAGAASRAGI